jgi:hypothetical protein
MQDIVQNGYSSPNYNGPPGDNDCTRWGQWWISCIGDIDGPCACAMANPGMGSCEPFANQINFNCVSACGGSVLAANMLDGGNPSIRVWGGAMANQNAGMGVL